MEVFQLASSSHDDPEPSASIIQARMDFEEDVEAELEEFMFLSRLGVEEEASFLFDEVLRKHISFFPVFVEVAYYLFRTQDFERLNGLQYASRSGTMQNASEEEVQFITFLWSANKTAQRISRSSNPASFTNMHREEAMAFRSSDCTSAAKIATVNISMLLNMWFKARNVYQYDAVEGWIQYLLQHGLNYEAAEVFLALTDPRWVLIPTQRQFFQRVYTNIARSIQHKANANDVGSGTEAADTLLCDQETDLVLCLTAFEMSLALLRHLMNQVQFPERFRSDSMDISTENFSSTDFTPQVLCVQAQQTMQNLFCLLPDPNPRGDYYNLLRVYQKEINHNELQRLKSKPLSSTPVNVILEGSVQLGSQFGELPSSSHQSLSRGTEPHLHDFYHPAPMRGSDILSDLYVSQPPQNTNQEQKAEEQVEPEQQQPLVQLLVQLLLHVSKLQKEIEQNQQLTPEELQKEEEQQQQEQLSLMRLFSFQQESQQMRMHSQSSTSNRRGFNP